MAKIHVSCSRVSVEFPGTFINGEEKEDNSPNNTEVIDNMSPIFSEFQKKLNSIEISNYSSDLDEVSILPECFADWCLLGEEYKERRYISWQNRFADIRLRIDFYKFKNSDHSTRKGIVYDTIIESIKIVDEKVKKAKKHFDGEKLMKDISLLLDYD